MLQQLGHEVLHGVDEEKPEHFGECKISAFLQIQMCYIVEVGWMIPRLHPEYWRTLT